MSFFDKLGKTITDTTHTVVEKTKTSTDTIRLNSQISEEERNINAAYLAIGKTYEQLHAEDYEAEFAPQVPADRGEPPEDCAISRTDPEK